MASTHWWSRVVWGLVRVSGLLALFAVALFAVALFAVAYLRKYGCVSRALGVWTLCASCARSVWRDWCRDPGATSQGLLHAGDLAFESCRLGGLKIFLSLA